MDSLIEPWLSLKYIFYHTQLDKLFPEGTGLALPTPKNTHRTLRVSSVDYTWAMAGIIYTHTCRRTHQRMMRPMSLLLQWSHVVGFILQFVAILIEVYPPSLLTLVVNMMVQWRDQWEAGLGSRGKEWLRASVTRNNYEEWFIDQLGEKLAQCRNHIRRERGQIKQSIHNYTSTGHLSPMQLQCYNYVTISPNMTPFMDIMFLPHSIIYLFFWCLAQVEYTGEPPNWTWWHTRLWGENAEKSSRQQQVQGLRQDQCKPDKKNVYARKEREREKVVNLNLPFS